MTTETSGTEFTSVFLVMRMRKVGDSLMRAVLLNSTTSKHSSSRFHENVIFVKRKWKKARRKERKHMFIIFHNICYILLHVASII